jgi:hypothetical protein
MVTITEKDSLVEANKKGYRDSDPGAWSKTKGVADANCQYTKHHPYKVAAVTVGALALVALTTAYFMSPAYAAYMGAAGAKVAGVVSPAITAVSAFLVAHPLIATFAIIAAVAAIVTASVLAYKNNYKANQIAREGKILNGDSPSTQIGDLKKVVDLAPEIAEVKN